MRHATSGQLVKNWRPKIEQRVELTMLGLVGALLLNVGLGPTAPQLAPPATPAPAPASSLAESGAAPASSPGAFTADPHLAGSYFGARYYGSKIGRFTTVDPTMNIKGNILNPQKWNRYAYGLNNPLRFVDLDGRQEGAALIQDRDIRALMNGEMSVAEYNARIEARAAGAVAGLAIVGAALAPALATEAGIAAGRCGASPACQNAVRGVAEGLSGAPPGSMGVLPTFAPGKLRSHFAKNTGQSLASKPLRSICRALET